MGKKKGGKSKGKISMGMHANVAKSTLKAVKADRPGWVRVINQLAAHKKGKRVMITIANPNKEETNKRFIRVPASTVWKDPKIAGFVMI